MDHPKKVLHLLRRTGFGTSKASVEQLLSSSISQIVDSILNAPADLRDNQLDPVYRNTGELQGWWYGVIASSKNPFLEKMTLFWHNHFTSSITNVGAIEMANQNELLRRYALGDFREFLLHISVDPAMMIYLNNRSNVKAAPNENYAREMMELFSLGVNNYSQEDVKNVARAITGWRYNGTSRTVFFDKGLYDSGSKTFLRRQGIFDLNDIVRIITSNWQCAYFITKKIWEKFVFPNPTENELRPFVDRFFNSNYNIKSLMRDLFTSDQFYSDKAYRSIVKDPTEYAIEMIKKVPTYAFNSNEVSQISAMGMPLFKPPNVAGWKEGEQWLSSTLFFARGTYAARVCNSATFASLGLVANGNKEGILNQLLDITGMYDISDTTKNQLRNYADTTSDQNLLLRGLLYLIYLSPEAQLK
jgi:uncharacterized protein (DUF1800 family)